MVCLLGYLLSNDFVKEPNQQCISYRNYDRNYPPINRFLAIFSKGIECQSPNDDFSFHLGDKNGPAIQAFSCFFFCATKICGEAITNDIKRKHLTNCTKFTTLFNTDANGADAEIFLSLPEFNLIEARMIKMACLYSTRNLSKGISSVAREFTAISDNVDRKRGKK